MTRHRTEPAPDHSTQPNSSIVETPKTRTARNQPQAAPVKATSEAANRPRRPVSRSATQARTNAPTTAMTMSAYSQHSFQDGGPPGEALRPRVMTSDFDLATIGGHTAPVAAE